MIHTVFERIIEVLVQSFFSNVLISLPITSSANAVIGKNNRVVSQSSVVIMMIETENSVMNMIHPRVSRVALYILDLYHLVYMAFWRFFLSSLVSNHMYRNRRRQQAIHKIHHDGQMMPRILMITETTPQSAIEGRLFHLLNL